MDPRFLLKRRTFLSGAAGAVGLSLLAAPRKAGSAEPSSGHHLDKAMEDLFAEMETKGRNLLSVPREDGEFLRLLVKAVRAKNVLEIGTSQGYSAAWLALGLRHTGGKLTTIEILPERVQMARSNLARVKLDSLITFRTGDAHKILPTLAGPFDLVLLDADKQGHADYFTSLFPDKLTPSAVLLSHNAIELKDKLEDYLKLVKNHPRFETVTLSLNMQDGFALSYRTS